MVKVVSKDKGDIGLSQVIADLGKRGVKVAIPLSEHLPFDLIAISDDLVLSRVSVKYRSINKRGIIDIPLRSMSCNTKGKKYKFLNKNDIDSFAIFCPDNGLCYYVNISDFSDLKTGLALRVLQVDDSHKNDPKINWAKDYLDFNVIFENDKKVVFPTSVPVSQNLKIGSPRQICTDNLNFEDSCDNLISPAGQ